MSFYVLILVSRFPEKVEKQPKNAILGDFRNKLIVARTGFF